MTPVIAVRNREIHTSKGRKGMYNAITDVKGIKVGHYTDLKAATGCTVVLCEGGAVGGVDVRGAAPGTRETDLLRPMHLVEKVHAILLTGGSAFGLNAATGVMRYLEERGIGYDTKVVKVPIVPDIAPAGKPVTAFEATSLLSMTISP